MPGIVLFGMSEETPQGWINPSVGIILSPVSGSLVISSQQTSLTVKNTGKKIITQTVDPIILEQ